MLSGLGEKIADILAWIIGKLWEWLVGPFMKLKSLKGWVFGEGDEELVYGTFTDGEMTTIWQPGFIIVMTLAGSLCVLAIVLHSMRIQTAAVNPSARNALQEFLKDLGIVAICLFNIPVFFDIVFSLNSSIVGVFSQAYEMKEVPLKIDTGKDVLGEFLIALVLLGLSVWANFYYMMRKFTLIVLMILSPLFAVLYLFPQTKGITIGATKEFTGTVFVNSVHAFIYWVLGLFAVSNDTGLEIIIMYIIFIPVGESLKALFGLGGNMSSNLSRAGAMLGLGAVTAMAGAIKGARDGGSVAGAVRGMANGLQNKTGNGEKDNINEGGKPTIAGNTGTDTGSTSVAEKMLKPGQILSKQGKAIFGMAGAIAGSPMGPVGSIIGAQGGSMLGGAVGGLTGRMGAAATQGITSRLKKGADAAKLSFNESLKEADDSIIERMADDETTAWASKANNRADFEKGVREKFPDIHPNDLAKKWNDRVAQQKSQNLESAKANWNNLKPMADAKDLVSKSTEAMTNQWAKDNKDRFMQNYSNENPPSKPLSEMNELEKQEYQNNRVADWNKKLDEKRSQFAGIATSTASSMLNGQKSGPVNRNQFAQALTNSVQNAEKSEFSKENPHLNSDQLDATFQNTHGNQIKALSGVIQSTADTAKSFAMPGGKPNVTGIAHYMASQRTQEAGKEFISNQIKQGITSTAATTQWKEQEQAVFNENFASSLANFSKPIPAQNTGIASLKAGASFIGGATGLATATKFAQNVATGGYQGWKNAVESNSTSTPLVSLGSRIEGAIKGGAGEISSSYQTLFNEGNAVANQSKFNNAVGYIGGVALGAKGYQIGSNIGTKVNPFNRSVNQQISEPSEVMHMAQTVTDEYGNQSIANGAVRMITTPNESYVQVRTKSGETRTVSRLGRGDSSLNKGEVVYQDLNVESGAFVTKNLPGTQTSAYKLDSGGAKIPSNRSINVNPNSLLANRALKGANTPTEIQSYNQKVDSGQFYFDDLRTEQFTNVELIVERGRSYLQGNKAGNSYRISQYQEGDARLPVGQSISKQVTIQNHRLVSNPSASEYEVNGKTEVYTTSIDPNDFISHKPNKRYMSRNAMERGRYKGVAL